jgi:hypothetical protein
MKNTKECFDFVFGDGYTKMHEMISRDNSYSVMLNLSEFGINGDYRGRDTSYIVERLIEQHDETYLIDPKKKNNEYTFIFLSGYRSRNVYDEETLSSSEWFMNLFKIERPKMVLVPANKIAKGNGLDSYVKRVRDIKSAAEMGLRRMNSRIEDMKRQKPYTKDDVCFYYPIVSSRYGIAVVYKRYWSQIQPLLDQINLDYKIIT